MGDADSRDLGSVLTLVAFDESVSEQTIEPPYSSTPTVLVGWPRGSDPQLGFSPWQSADDGHTADMSSSLNMDFMDTNIIWNMK